MKFLGYAVLLVAVVVGLGVLSNLISRMSTEQCMKECPTTPEALSTKAAVGPFVLKRTNRGTRKR